MLGCSLRRFTRTAHEAAPGLAVLAALALPGALLLSCFPEQALSSYAGGAGSGPVLPVPPVSNDADAAPAEAPVAAGDAAVDAGEQAIDVLDAAPARVLLCSEACACERRDERDFMFCGEPVVHDVAVERCSAAGGTLVSIDGDALNVWLSERMQALAVDDFWLSGTDADVEGVWRWQDGSVFYDAAADASVPVAFAPWDTGQPNDLNGEDCMRSTAGVWRDLQCTTPIAYVCQG